MNSPNGINGPKFELKDGAFYANILALATFFTAYFPTLQLNDLGGESAFRAIQFLLSAFFTNFIALTGISKLLARKT